MHRKRNVSFRRFAVIFASAATASMVLLLGIAIADEVASGAIDAGGAHADLSETKEDGMGVAHATAAGSATNRAAGHKLRNAWSATEREPEERSSTPQFEQDEAREALRRGWVAPLGKALAAVRNIIQGDVLEVNLKHEKDGEWVYVLRILTSSGRYRVISVDARNSRVLSINGH